MATRDEDKRESDESKRVPAIEVCFPQENPGGLTAELKRFRETRRRGWRITAAEVERPIGLESQSARVELAISRLRAEVEGVEQARARRFCCELTRPLNPQQDPPGAKSVAGAPTWSTR